MAKKLNIESESKPKLPASTIASPKRTSSTRSKALVNTSSAPAETTQASSVQTRPSQEEIARLAYFLWEARGRANGSAVEDWLRAEQEFHRRQQIAQ